LTVRIAYVDHTGVLSGGEVALCNLIGALDRRRWDPVVVLGQPGPLRDRLEAAGVKVSVLRLPPILSQIRQGEISLAAELHPHRLASSLLYSWRLAQRLRAWKIGLIHANTLRACVLGGVAGRLAEIPSVWQVHSVVGSPLMAARGLSLLRFLARRWPSEIICNSRTTAADFGISADRVSVIPCGVDSGRFLANGRVPGNRPRIGMIARFAPMKGQIVFVEAAGRLADRYPEAEFIVAGTPLFGEGTYASQVQAAARCLPNASAISFLGFVDDVPGLLNTLDVVVHPSIHPEGLGQVIIEAMMAGKPVIASASGGPVELIQDGMTGRLVAPGDSEALANALDEILRDPAGAMAMGRRAREHAVAGYDIKKTTREIEDVYERVLAAA
jgi:glycosyltransferase involved in cell wall biosynthesis